MRNIRLDFIYFLVYFLLLSPFLSGCAAVAISAAGAGAGVGLPYVLSDCADRTVNYSFDQVDRVAPRVLKNMDIPLLAETETETGKRIRASTGKLEIFIDMEKVTMRATRVIVNTKKGTFLKDRATAEEILNQLEKGLLAEKNAVPEKSLPGEKGPGWPKGLTKSELAMPPRPTHVGFQEGFQ